VIWCGTVMLLGCLLVACGAGASGIGGIGKKASMSISALSLSCWAVLPSIERVGTWTGVDSPFVNWLAFHTLLVSSRNSFQCTAFWHLLSGTV
jgi:hypothetical protein